MNALLLSVVVAIAPSPPPQAPAPQRVSATQQASPADHPDTSEIRREALAKIERARLQREQDDTASK